MQDSRSPAALQTHPLSDSIPWMRNAEWGVFLEDIMQRGILEPLQQKLRQKSKKGEANKEETNNHPTNEYGARNI